MEVWEALAREEIRHVISRYNHAGDRGRLGELAACFAADGALDLADEPPIRGRAAIERRLAAVVSERRSAAGRPLVRHHVSSVRIELEGPDAARADSYFLVFTEVGLDHWGRYRDRFARGPAGWRIAERRVRVDGASPRSAMAPAHRGEG